MTKFKGLLPNRQNKRKFREMDLEEYIKQKWRKLFHFLNADNGNTLFLHDFMEMPCRQIKAGNVDDGVEIATAFKQHWDRVLEAAYLPNTAQSINQDDWINGQIAVSQTDWYHTEFSPVVNRAFFDSMDSNKDDRISIKEWREYYNSHKVYDEDFIQSTFKKMDADGDGFITRDEFYNANHVYDTHHEPGNDYSFLYTRY